MNNDKDAAIKLAEAAQKIRAQLGLVLIGQEEVVGQILIALFARGHALLVGVPGLAKTLIVSSLSHILDLKFSRVQFTPDLMPSDIIGFEMIEESETTRKRALRFMEGPVFANMILADEINRTPPKTQSALLQAMQEYHVTAAGKTRPLPLPFFVLATQNPIEQEGTYPLPEAQLDRFLLQINVGYPSGDQEKRIAAETTGVMPVLPEKILGAQEVTGFQELVRRVPVDPAAVALAVALARASRPEAGSPEYVSKWVTWGAGPRGSQSLVLAAKARCLLDGRFAAAEEDVRQVAKPVMRHRLILNFQAEADGVKPDDLIEKLLADIKV